MITNILSSIKDIFIWIFKKLTFRDWIIIILLSLCTIFYLGYKHYYTKSLTPIVVYDVDSLSFYKNKIKEEYVAKDIYVLDIKNLEKQNNILSEELRKLKDNPIVITKTKLLVKIDTIYTLSDSIIYNDSIYNLLWHVDEPHNYYSVNGITNVHNGFLYFNTLINNLQMNTDIILDILDNGDKFKIVSRSSNPYINIVNMDGVVFDPTLSKVLKKYYKRKRWSIGPMIGYGLTSDLRFEPYIGIGVSYGVIQF